jgi:hypothetical protein
MKVTRSTVRASRAHIRHVLGWVHVAVTIRGAVREVLEHLSPRNPPWRAWTPAARKELLRIVAREHWHNRDVYVWAMYPGRKCWPRPSRRSP